MDKTDISQKVKKIGKHSLCNVLPVDLSNCKIKA